jgi:hypothetical protein
MDQRFISSLPYIFQDGTNFFFEAKTILGHSSLHLGKVPFESLFSYSKNLHERASLDGLFFIPKSLPTGPGPAL